MFRLRPIARTIRRAAYQRRCFTENVERKVGETQHKGTMPPPPPRESNSGFWLLLTGALAGAGYYFKDDLMALAGSEEAAQVPSSSAEPVIEVDVKEVKEVIEKAETLLKPEIEVSKGETSPPAPVVKTGETDWDALRKAIVEAMEDEKFDNGSAGPLLVRLAWHSAGTYDKVSKTGGSEGAGMRFEPESTFGANTGLHVARSLMEEVKKGFPEVSYSDLWSFAGTVAIEEMSGDEDFHLDWRPGRKDYDEGEHELPDGRLPDGDGRDHPKDVSVHIREIFNRMGFNDQEIVCLMGAHALGETHTFNSGYTGPWTFSPTTFSNNFFELLVEDKWTLKTEHNGKPWTGPEQYTDSSGELMMLPTDMAMIRDPKFEKWTRIYAKDEKRFFNDFNKAWKKLQENGVKKFNGRRRYYFFGPRV